MNKPRFFLLILIITLSGSISAQTTQIKEIHFPYKPGYVFQMADTVVRYDDYNFPAEYIIRESKYVVEADPSQKNTLIFQYSIVDKSTDKVILNTPSYLTWGKKGMSWWGDKSSDLDTKKTQAIKLPLKKGSSWKSSFSGQTAVMTCVNTDTLLTTMYGRIPCFGVSYEIVIQEDKATKIGLILTEYYHVYAGKVYNEDITFIENKSTGKRKIVQKGWSKIIYSNVDEAQKNLIK